MNQDELDKNPSEEAEMDEMKTGNPQCPSDTLDALLTQLDAGVERTAANTRALRDRLLGEVPASPIHESNDSLDPASQGVLATWSAMIRALTTSLDESNEVLAEVVEALGQAR